MFYEKITQKELKKLEVNGVTPLFTYEKLEIDKEYNVNYINLTIIKTANEVHQEWLDNKNNPPKKEPTEVEQLQKQLLETQALVAELRYKSIMKEKWRNINV